MRAARSDPRGMYNLGRFYERGRGPVPERIERAVELYQQACDAALADACFSLAARLARGGEALSDPERARILFDRACQLGQPAACAQLGKPAPTSAP
jgi:TPR repeat protein